MSEAGGEPVPAIGRVRALYGRFPFPGTRAFDGDGLVLMRRVGEALRNRGPAPRVLDAGCGTGNTTVALARAFPAAEFVGIDICPESLEQARAGAEGLANVRFELRDITGPTAAGDSFDLVLCLGVLHHTADMRCTLRALAARLRTGGSLFLWVYGSHGRHRHGLNTRLLRMLLPERSPEAADVELARQFAVETDGGAPLRDLYGAAADDARLRRMALEDAWIADQFLHVHETAVDLDGLLDLLEAAGLALDRWFGVGPEAAERFGPLRARYEDLPRRERLRALDLLMKPARYFVSASPSP